MANSVYDLLQQMTPPAIPTPSALSPQDENGFQSFMAFDPNVRKWNNGFQAQYGESPNLNDPSFDYRQAYMAGNKPQLYPVDGTMHWDSRGKQSTHPTEWMNTYMRQFGSDPNVTPQGGYTPAMTSMINGALPQNVIQNPMPAIFQRGLWDQR